MHTILSFLSIIFLLINLFKTAILVAPAGSTNIPSYFAKLLCASPISLSVTVKTVPLDSRIAFNALFQLTGAPILIAVANVLGLLIGFQLQRSHVQIAYYTWMMVGLYILLYLINIIYYTIKIE